MNHRTSQPSTLIPFLHCWDASQLRQQAGSTLRELSPGSLHRKHNSPGPQRNTKGNKLWSAVYISVLSETGAKYQTSIQQLTHSGL